MFGALGLPSIGPWELIIILAVVLIIFGPGKLPDVGKSLGKTIQEFRKAQNGEDKKKEPVKENTDSQAK